MSANNLKRYSVTSARVDKLLGKKKGVYGVDFGFAEGVQTG
jgi:hypothetical protein